MALILNHQISLSFNPNQPGGEVIDWHITSGSEFIETTIPTSNTKTYHIGDFQLQGWFDMELNAGADFPTIGTEFTLNMNTDGTGTTYFFLLKVRRVVHNVRIPGRAKSLPQVMRVFWLSESSDSDWVA